MIFYLSCGDIYLSLGISLFPLFVTISQLFCCDSITLSFPIISPLASVVCVCVFIFFHREGFFRLQDVQDIPEGTDQRSCVVNIS